MARGFIPSFHFVNPSKKLTPSWCLEAVNYCYHGTSNRHLLHGKKRAKIDAYASGDFDMDVYKRMFKSIKRAMDFASHDQANAERIIDKADTTGLDWRPLPLIPSKLNAAISTISKIPVEATCTATDELAAKKKMEDIRFLKRKKEVEEKLQGFAAQMGMDKVDLGTTRYSDIPLGDNPYGLNLSNPSQSYIFENILYSLGIESGYETMLQAWWNLKNAQMIEAMEIKDQFKYGVSCHRTFASGITMLPDLEYVDPEHLYTPESKLPDYSDNSHRYIDERVTAMELFNYIGHEIKNESDIFKMLTEKGCGYCSRNKLSPPSEKNWQNFEVDLIFFEIKSVDWIGVKKVNRKSTFKTFTTEESEAEYKLWAQNTYAFVWLKNTDYIFCIERLDGMYRAEGQESIQGFSTNIYKSQEKSAVEQAINENMKAQVADIKMQHAIISSLPAGKVIDLRFLRGAITALDKSDDDDENATYTIHHLLQLALEKNLHIGDTEDYDRPSDGQLKPIMEISGGLKTEIEGYIRVIADANSKISLITGINEQLTGQQANPEGLVGLQRLLINSSINSLYYCNQAISHQLKRMFTSWTWLFKKAIEAGGEPKKAVINLIGAQKTQLIDQMEDAPLHTVGIFVDIGQREIERQRFENSLAVMKEKGIISATDEYMISYVSNPKDKLALLAVREQEAIERQREQQQAMMKHQQELAAQQGQNQIQAIQTEAQAKAMLQDQKSQNELAMEESLARIGFQRDQFNWQAKSALQDKRMAGQKDKSISTLREKTNQEAQAPLI